MEMYAIVPVRFDFRGLVAVAAGSLMGVWAWYQTSKPARRIEPTRRMNPRATLTKPAYAGCLGSPY